MESAKLEKVDGTFVFIVEEEPNNLSIEPNIPDQSNLLVYI